MASTLLLSVAVVSFTFTGSMSYYISCGPNEEWYFPSSGYPPTGLCRPRSCSCSCQGTSGTFHGDWTTCSASCGSGTRSRQGIRFDSCGNSHNLDLETRPCYQQPCPVNGAWSSWGPFSNCSGGIQVRFRSCDHPSPSIGGLPCIGDSLQTASCQEFVTLTNPILSVASTLSPRSVNKRETLP